MLSKLALGDVRDQADVGTGRPERLDAIQDAEVAVVPSTAKQG